MIKRMASNCGDETCPSCVVAGDFIYLAHHGGGFESEDIVVQMEACFERVSETLAGVGASLEDMVQIHLYLKNIEDFRRARDVFFKYFDKEFPARMATTTEFVSEACLCMIDGVAYKKMT